MSYNDGGDQPSNGQIKAQPRQKHQQPFKDGYPGDQRVWKYPGRGQEPAPQASRPAPPDTDSDNYFFSGPTHSKSSVSGKAGVHHLAGEQTQYAFSLERGLHQREEGLRQHEHNATADAESLHPASIADVKRAKYSGDQQGGNQHKATGYGATLVRSGLTRKGQGPKPQGDNETFEQGGF